MASCDAQFGPKVDTSCRSFDFTLYFEDAIFAAAPSAIFIIFSILPLLGLIRQRNIVKSSILLALKLVTYSIVATG